MARYTSKSTPTNFSVDSARRTYEQIALDNNEQFGVVLAGDVSDTTTDNTQNDASSLIEKAAFYSKIKESDVSLVAERNDFKVGNVYDRWTSGKTTRRHYALNTTNNIVYLCIRGANNPFWRRDYDGQSSFTSTPSELCETIYPDESIWMALYKINPGQDLSHLGKYLPFRTLTEEERLLSFYDSVDPASEANQICGASSTKESGTCCLYHKTPYYDAITGVTFGKGDFYKCDCTKCYKCIDMARRMNMDYLFNSSGVSGSTYDKCKGCDTETFPTDCGACTCTISTQSAADKIKERSNASHPASNVGVLGDILTKCNTMGGGIKSMFIDFSGLQRPDLKLIGTGPWPLNISSTTGSDAQWEVVGYSEDGGKTYYASGLKKVNEGFNYLTATVSNLSEIFENEFSSSRLEVNITPMSPNGLIDNIAEILNNVKVQISKSFRSSYLRDTVGLDLSSFNRLGVVKNMTAGSGKTVVGAGSNANQIVDKSLITKLVGTPSTTTSSSGKGSGFSLTKDEQQFGTQTTDKNITFGSSTSQSDGTTKLQIHSTKPAEFVGAETLKDTTNDITYTLDKTQTVVPKEVDSVIDTDSGEYVATKTVNWTMPNNNGIGSREKSFRDIITLGNITE